MYTDSDQELANTVRLSGPYFTDDNKTLWDLLAPLISGGAAWSYVRQYERSHNGHAAIEVLHNQCMGAASATSRKAAAYSIISSIAYTGKSSKFTFDDYNSKLQYAFSELIECNENIGESFKTTALVNGIKTDKLDSGIDTLTGRPDLLEDYVEAAAYMSSVVQRKLSYETGSHRHVASTGQATTGLRMSYTAEEWRALPQATKDKVIKKRKDDKAKSETKTKPADTKTAKGYKRKIKSLTKKLEEAKTKESDDDSDSDTKPAAKASPKKKL